MQKKGDGYLYKVSMYTMEGRRRDPVVEEADKQYLFRLLDLLTDEQRKTIILFNRPLEETIDLIEDYLKTINKNSEDNFFSIITKSKNYT